MSVAFGGCQVRIESVGVKETTWGCVIRGGGIRLVETENGSTMMKAYYIGLNFKSPIKPQRGRTKRKKSLKVLFAQEDRSYHKVSLFVGILTGGE